MTANPLAGAAPDRACCAPARFASDQPPSAAIRAHAAWPPERLTRLRDLFDEGLSHQLIAARMGVGKGVVSAKIARLGWRRGETVRTLREPPPVVAFDPGRMRRLEDLGRRDCRWPTLFDAAGVQLFCGCPTAPRMTYCGAHQVRAHRRPRAWEREAAAPRSPPPPPERFGWERFG